MSVIKDICQKVTLLENGKLVVSGKVDELFMNQPEALKSFLGEEQLYIDMEGTNIQIMLSDEDESKGIFSNLARDLDINFTVVNGEMERYRDKYLGSMIINFNEEHTERVAEYLTQNRIIWRYYRKEEK